MPLPQSAKKLEEFTKPYRDNYSTRLSIARVPAQLKVDFVHRAEEKHCGDYGVLLTTLWANSNEYDKVKEVLLGSGLEVKIDKGKISISKNKKTKA